MSDEIFGACSLEPKAWQWREQLEPSEYATVDQLARANRVDEPKLAGSFRKILYQQLLDAIVIHRVGNRPNRFESRRIKRKNGAYDWLTKPRDEMKRDILKQHSNGSD